MDQNNKKSLPPVLSRILTVVAIIVVFVLARLLLGSQEMMYLSAKDIDHIDVAVNPDGIVLTSTGDDSAAAVKILNKTICYYPRQEEAAGQAVTLTIYMHDETTMTVTACGDYFNIDGKGYKTRLSDGEKLAEWAEALAEKQGIQS